MNGLLPGEKNDYTPTTIMNTNHLMVETEDTFSSLLELAANNNIEGIKRWIDRDPSSIDEVGQWYGRQKGSKQMVLDHRTALMVAATYGSIDALILILSLPEVDVNRTCGRDKSTALHCAASGGSLHALDAIKLLLESGADPKLVDGNGHRPLDVVFVPPTFRSMKPSIQNLLNGLTVDSPLPDSTTSSSSPESENLNPKKEYPVDPSLPDIKNGIFSTDEFRMFSFKIRPCSRAYSHDWTECPFVHPGENARRRDPRKYHYSCVPCPEFRKGACRRGDMCEYAHGVFECWLHPAQYRTRLCKDGTLCNRRVCFFAHAQEELRPLYVSTGSGMGSPSSPFTPPMSPSNNSFSNMGWPMQNVPTLLLPGSNNFQSSRLRSSFHARDILGDQDFNRSGCSKTMTPSNLEDLFSAESSSPRYSSPTHKSAVFNQFQQQQPSVLSPINTKFSPDNPSLLAASFGAPSPRVIDPISPLSSRVSLLARCEKQQQFRSLSSRDLGSSASSAWSKWGLPSEEKPDWAFNTEEFGGKLRRSSSFELANNNGGDEPDLSWVQSLVKESPQEMKAAGGSDENNSGEGSSLNPQMEQIDQSTLHAWLEQMHLDQLMAQ
ncbi:unnamed protein product [Cuscuta epithymum]|uniref:C3H1-type domain-containing protein n=1 Tax=Cuscuta epithymum TaxID=186058 RepID=A0AAV0DN01_9ASTE|nr:unnamed protein product [Cuscuta epithymum]